MKKVSIIIPVYNAEKYIASTLNSALGQTHQDLEILIVDDGSPDRSIEICQQFKDERIRIIRQQNRGGSGARNTGIRHAKGKYLAFLDADDMWLPYKIEKHISHLEDSTMVGVSFSYSRFIDELDNPLGLYQFSKVKDITPLDLLCRTPIGNGSAAVFKKEVFEDIQFQSEHKSAIEDHYFDEQFRGSQDVECWMRIALKTSWKIEGIPEALTLYRVNSKGISANLSQKLEAWQELIRKIYSYAPEEMTQWEKPALAYHLRHLSRRAVTLKDKTQAVSLFYQAIVTYWQIIVEEPYRTGLTGAAAALLWILPSSMYDRLFQVTVKFTGNSQQKRIMDVKNTG